MNSAFTDIQLWLRLYLRENILRPMTNSLLMKISEGPKFPYKQWSICKDWSFFACFGSLSCDQLPKLDTLQMLDTWYLTLDTFYWLQMYQKMLNQKIYPGEKMIITIFCFSFWHAFLKIEIIFYQKKNWKRAKEYRKSYKLIKQRKWKLITSL